MRSVKSGGGRAAQLSGSTVHRLDQALLSDHIFRTTRISWKLRNSARPDQFHWLIFGRPQMRRLVVFRVPHVSQLKIAYRFFLAKRVNPEGITSWAGSLRRRLLNASLRGHEIPIGFSGRKSSRRDNT